MHEAAVVTIVFPILLASALVYWSHLRATRQPAEHTGPVVRVATLNASSKRADTAWWTSTALALVPLLVSAVTLGIFWKRLPVRLPIHWGFNGHPNGWAARSPWTVFGPLAGGATVVALLTYTGVGASRYSPGFAGRKTVLGAALQGLRAVAWLISMLFSAAACLPLAKDSTAWVYFVVAGSVVASLLLLAFLVDRSLRLPKEALTAARRTTDDRFWTAGLIYRNPDDPALWVPKRTGLGYTLNFGQPVAWMVLIGILLFAVAYPVAMHTLFRQ